MENSTHATAFSPNAVEDTHTIKHAVILAAGKSSRFREKGIQKPKVLLPVGGLRLMERSILTLKQAGVQYFRVVLGAYREQIREEISKSVRLKDVDVQFIECPDYELGNGVSFGAGADGIEEPFFLTMCDHIFSPQTIVDFGKRANEQPNMPALACDPNLEDVFDMDDATKVFSKDGKIHKISKQLEEYDLVDTGLFYFPKGYGNKIAEKVKNGATSVSNVIQQLIEETGVRCPSLPNAVWQDVDYPGMKKEAERRLMRSIGSPNDGWVSRYINRHFSTRISLQLARFGIHPNWVTTFVLLLTLVGAVFAGSGVDRMIIIGAFIFQIASILDGCDGELARLTYQNSWFGAWYDRLIGNIRYALFFGALGVSAYKVTGSEVYYFGVIIFGALAFYMILQVAINAWKEKKVTDYYAWKPIAEDEKDIVIIDRFFLFWREINKDDVITFIGFLLCIVFLYQFMFWLALVGTVFMAITISRSMASKGQGKPMFGIIDPIFFYLFGVLILSFLIWKMDLTVVATSMEQVGMAVFFVFATALFWIPFNTLCIANLLQYRVPFIDLVYNQLTGGAYNAIIPLAGLGGEPYKIKHLTQWLDWHTASRAIVQDRLIHSQTGIMFTVINLALTLIFVPLESKYFIPLSIATGILAVVSGIMVWITLSSAPSKISGYVLKKLNFLDEFKNEPLPPKRYLGSLFFKLTARFLNLIEIYAIFRILGFHPEFMELVMIAGFVALSATIFFVVPQGLGVNEVGISSALSLLGYSAALGLTFGLIRRARMIFWALFGVALHLAVVFYKRLVPVGKMIEK